ncbi:MAG: dTDP-4-dehydrorhamnose reductase [bacterium]|nr:dTDP-4-dehydrorhamnose reductase [bacterium]MCY3891377.1 dTDP-4-dehydrorhamnose reductase [bacterium]MCY3963155.1 dTDP-4-dehydrorhamnose reductase [bacterium]MCY4135449.1 dTDP-4-dehydrorhamnose reductase [bacterium]
MKVLVTGAAGQLGCDVAAQFADSGHDVIAARRRELDVSRREQVLGVVGSVQPDVLVNCAAYTAVDACETDAERAYEVNALAVRHLAEAAYRFDAHLCHVSTDYVFSGDKAEPYHEWDQPDPRSVYGASKLAGEQEVGEAATVVRTSWLCGRHGANVVATVLRLAAEGGPLRFVNDQRGSPSFTPDVAIMIERLCVDRSPGLYHVTNRGEASWYEFAREVMVAAGHDPDRVEPITTAELDPPRLAPRPANSVLENRALGLTGLDQPPDYRESLHRLVADLRG